MNRKIREKRYPGNYDNNIDNNKKKNTKPTKYERESMKEKIKLKNSPKERSRGTDEMEVSVSKKEAVDP